ncbi:MAG: homoserine O-succinyltransferase, partial [Gammaproteobacteria bacterium]
MPLVANTELPSFSRLSEEGGTVLSREHAVRQDIRALHIGLLNMMPDKALEATERQFLRLVGESNQIAQFYVHPFTLKEISRDQKAQAHIDQYYTDFNLLKEQGLDALIITGANVVGPELSAQPFWRPLKAITEWAYENVTSTLCSCLATHALLEFQYGLKRYALPEKRWGIYSHRVM